MEAKEITIDTGVKYHIYYGENNVNNMKIEVRAIVDNEVVVFRTQKLGTYRMESLSYFTMMAKNGVLKKL